VRKIKREDEKALSKAEHLLHKRQDGSPASTSYLAVPTTTRTHEQ